MTTVTVRIPTALRTYCEGHARVEIDIQASPPTVSAVLDALAHLYPGVVERVLDEQRNLRRHVHVFVGEDDVRALGGLTASIGDGLELSILPAVSGGDHLACGPWRSSPKRD